MKYRYLTDARLLQSDNEVGVVGLELGTGMPLAMGGIKAIDFSHGVVHGSDGAIIFAADGFSSQLPPDGWPELEDFAHLGTVRALGTIEAEYWQKEFAELALTDEVVIDPLIGVARRLTAEEVKARA